MEYYKATFNITNTDDSTLADPDLMQTAKDLLCALAAEAGFESFEEQEADICGYVHKKAFNATVLNSVLGSFPLKQVRISYTIADAEDKDWNAEWEQQGFEPILIGGRCVIHDTMHHTENKTEGVIDITIDAKLAFGTGTHDTTRMIATELLGMNLSGCNILDCGCGTGILSIVASKAGAKSVSAYDIDRWSVENTRHNCDLNNVSNVNSILGDSAVIPALGSSFNIVLANINRNILLADMPRMSTVMPVGALLIISGFYTKDAQMLCDKAAVFNLHHIKSKESNGWCMVVLKKV